MSGITPGTWSVWTATHPNDDGIRYYIDAPPLAGSNADTETVALVFDEPDAVLIAAAPELLRALTDIRDGGAYCAASKARAAMALETLRSAQ